MKILLDQAEVANIVLAAQQQALMNYAIGLGLAAGEASLSVAVHDDGTATIETMGAPAAPAAPKTNTPAPAKRQQAKGQTPAAQPTPAAAQAPVVNGDTQLGGQATTPAAATATRPALFSKGKPPDAPVTPAQQPESDLEMAARMDAQIAEMNQRRAIQADQIQQPPAEDEVPFDVDTQPGEPANEAPDSTPEPQAEEPPPPPPSRPGLFSNLRRPQNP